MKRRKKQMPVPQWEFGFSAETFNLMQETGIDGDRISREKSEMEEARAVTEAAQSKLFRPSSAFSIQSKI